MRKQRTPKYYALCGALGLLAIGPVSSALAANLLLNPGFEAPTDPDRPDPNVSTLISGWNFVGDTARSRFHGSHEVGGQWNVWLKTFLDQDGGVEQAVTVQAGQNYALSAWEWLEPGALTTAAIVKMQMTWLDGGGSPIGSPAVFTQNVNQVQPPTGQWLQQTLNGTAPAGAASVRVFLGHNFGGGGSGAQSIFWDDAILDGPGTPPSSSQWIINGSGDWNAAGNWASGTIPNSVGATAEFLSIITGAQTVFTNTGVTVGTLNFNNANTYVIAGAGSITLQASAGNAFVNVLAGTQKINVPLTIASSTTLSVAAGATLKISDPVTINTGRVISQTGAGQVIYESIVNVQGQAGLLMGNTTHMAALNLASGGTAAMATNGSRVLKTDNLNITSGGTLNLNDNDMIVVNGTYATISGQIRNARNGGLWNQPGITSATAAAANPKNKTLGTVTGAQFHAAQGSSALFDGFSVTDTSVLVKFTYYGDADLNGIVNFDDYSRTDAGFNSGGSTWFQGDFDYNGAVNFDDYSLIDAAFNTQSGSLRRAMAYLDGNDRSDQGMNTPALQTVMEHFDQFGVPYAQSFLNAVPEPTTAAFGMIAAATMGLRRRRR